MKTVVIGAGASGIVSAIFASLNSEDVIVLEKEEKPLKKLLITGNGRCNYFNEKFDIDSYHSTDIDILKKIITKENQDLFLSFFKNLGIVPRVINNCYYPYSNMASQVRELLLLKTSKEGVNIITSSYVKEIYKKENNFRVLYNDKEIICDRVIISTGSKAYPKTGSDGNGYSLALRANHTINKIYPGLTRLIGKKSYFKKWDGVRSNVIISLYENGRFLKQEVGELQFTKTGISGICVFNLSNMVSKGLLENKKEEIRINFMPFLEANSDYYLWFEKQTQRTNNMISKILEGFLNYKLIDIILSLCNIGINQYWYEIDDEKKELLIDSLTNFVFVPKETAFDSCQVCGGGVSLREINPFTMESKIVDSLYLTGEILDVVGNCGGYNLGFAFITGMLAGKRGLK